MIIYRARIFDTPRDPFDGGELRVETDGGLLVEDGKIIERGDFTGLRARHREVEVVTLTDGVLLPGLVDTHVHYPQVRVIGQLGKPLLSWLEEDILPEEVRLGADGYASEVAEEFLTGLIGSGTTSALVFGSHFAAATDILFAAAARRGLRMTAGLVTSDRHLPEPLLTTPERCYADASALIERWHGVGRLRYAVTPRFAYSAGESMLEAATQLIKEDDGVWCTSHLNENVDEIAAVAKLFGAARDYLDCYDRAGLLGGRTVLAHNVHPTDRELDRLAATRTVIAHCPTSNASLASGSFPWRRHRDHGVRVALGTDVGGGTGFSLFKEALQAYFTQRLRPDGLPLGSAHLLHLATAAGADALGLADQVGDLSVGKQFDAVWLRPPAGQPLAVGLRHARDDHDALARIFALGTPADIAGVWIGGTLVHPITGS
ncbi:guanine deaminase [Microlunatus soli]|uniref:Guanine deaminase n=1 Tax=Microlunatus soli TaxID=630515 RepID=A0A1H1X3E7_9ACTN|nr:guanine deaminase [Microlunatus soli]SDT03682.1 guanine deaminase [Microlunatus soli]